VGLSMLSSYRIYYSRKRRKPRSFFENPTLLTCALNYLWI
jgi:hypothetical protein